jgi:hypothetical protein
MLIRTATRCHTHSTATTFVLRCRKVSTQETSSSRECESFAPRGVHAPPLTPARKHTHALTHTHVYTHSPRLLRSAHVLHALDARAGSTFAVVPLWLSWQYQTPALAPLILSVASTITHAYATRPATKPHVA